MGYSFLMASNEALQDYQWRIQMVKLDMRKTQQYKGQRRSHNELNLYHHPAVTIPTMVSMEMTWNSSERGVYSNTGLPQEEKYQAT